MFRFLFGRPDAAVQHGITVATMLAEINTRHGSRVMCWVYRRFRLTSLHGRISERHADALLDMAAQAHALLEAVEQARAEAGTQPVRHCLPKQRSNAVADVHSA